GSFIIPWTSPSVFGATGTWSNPSGTDGYSLGATGGGPDGPESPSVSPPIIAPIGAPIPGINPPITPPRLPPLQLHHSPLGSTPFVALIPTYRYRLASPALNPIGSMLIHLPIAGS